MLPFTSICNVVLSVWCCYLNWWKLSFWTPSSCALILLQMGANVKDNVIIPPVPKNMIYEADKKRKPIWKWQPIRNMAKRPQKHEHSIFQVCKQTFMDLFISCCLDPIQARLSLNRIPAFNHCVFELRYICFKTSVCDLWELWLLFLAGWVPD